MTSLLDRPITAASDDGVSTSEKRCQAAADTPQNIKLNLICIINCTTSENVLKFVLLIKQIKR